MPVYTEYLDHVRASENQTSSDYLVTGLLMRAAICLAFIGTGAVFALI
jgi:hypothetical protein